MQLQNRFLKIIQGVLIFFGVVIAVFSLGDWESFHSQSEQFGSILTGLAVILIGMLLGWKPIRTRLLKFPTILLRIGALISIWALILSFCLVGIELYARNKSGDVLLSFTVKPKHSTFSELYQVYVWNEDFYKANPSFFDDWPIPISFFKPAHPDPNVPYRLSPNTKMTIQNGILGPAKPGDTVYWSSNSWGFRGPEFSVQKPAGVIRIVCMGASTTAGMQADNETYPYYLQQELAQRFPGQKIEVINAGIYGLGVKDFPIIFRDQVLPLQPDIVLFYEGNNTLRLEDFVPDLPCSLWSCWLETRPVWYHWLYTHSAAFSNIANQAGWNNVQPPPMPHKFNEALTPSETAYRDGLTELVRDIQGQGITVVLSSFITIAHDGFTVTYDQSPTAFDALYKQAYPLTPGEIGRIYDRINQQSKAIASEFNAPYADVASGFPREVQYFDYDYFHLSPKGNQLLASRFAEYLSEYVLPAFLNQRESF